MTNFAPPPQSTLGKVWSAWFDRTGRTLNYLTESGTYANRPTRGLYIGRPYFATDKLTNGAPIYWNGTTWVYASGVIVT